MKLVQSMEGEERKFVEVMYNASYGGFGFSKEAKQLYCREMNVPEESVRFSRFSRTDPVMIRIVKDLGERANGNFSNICLERIDVKYENHFYIEEYDGYECVKIDYKEFKLERIRAAIESEELALEAKVEAVRGILRLREEESE